jgi:hypothetical protein
MAALQRKRIVDVSLEELPLFTQGYIGSAIWLCDPDPHNTNLNPTRDLQSFVTNKSYKDIYKRIQKGHKYSMIKDAQKFFTHNSSLLYALTGRILPKDQYNNYPSTVYDRFLAGMDLYYTRNGFGAGYASRGPQPHWQELEAKAKLLGMQELDFFCATAKECATNAKCITSKCDKYNERNKFKLVTV